MLKRSVAIPDLVGIDEPDRIVSPVTSVSSSADRLVQSITLEAIGCNNGRGGMRDYWGVDRHYGYPAVHATVPTKVPERTQDTIYSQQERILTGLRRFWPRY